MAVCLSDIKQPVYQRTTLRKKKRSFGDLFLPRFFMGVIKNIPTNLWDDKIDPKLANLHMCTSGSQ